MYTCMSNCKIYLNNHVGTQATTDLTVRVGAAVGGVIIFVLLVIFVILMVLLVVMKRRTSIKYATFK